MRDTVQGIIQKYSGGSYYWKSGTQVTHPKHGLVQITGGSYLGSYGRVSNFFYWREVKKDGSLGEVEYHGYGWA